MERSKIVMGKLEMVLHLADERDIGFCYELMCHNMRGLFDRNTQEKWSRDKFKSGFKPNRVTMVEHKNMPIGFFDYELVEDELYCHNIQLSEDYQNGIGTQIIRLIEQVARDCGASAVIGKVFYENSKMINWLQRQGYNLNKKIEQENSYWLRKNLE